VSFRLGQCALELGQTAEAARRFDKIASEGPNHYLAPAAAYFAGEAHFKLNEFPAAAKAYAATVKNEKSEYARGALYGLCWSLYKAGEFTPAIDSLQLFLQRHPKDPAAAEMQFLLGECCLRDGKPADALAAFQKVPQGEWYDDALSGAGFAAAGRRKEHDGECERCGALHSLGITISTRRLRFAAASSEPATMGCVDPLDATVSRFAAGVVFIHQPAESDAIAIRTNVTTDPTRPGKVAGGKVED
jgi:tetratricopeptide (TPR) repeat protein